MKDNAQKILEAASALYAARNGYLRPCAERELWIALGEALGADTTWGQLPKATPEHGEWRTVPGFPFYDVAEAGAVRRAVPGRFHKGQYAPGRILRATIGRHGYFVMNLRDAENRQRTALVHRMVAAAFHGPAPGDKTWVAHWDGDKLNNHWRNLRWATPAENYADAIRHGRVPRGDRYSSAKATFEKAAIIRSEYAAGGVLVADLAHRHKLSKATVSAIINKRIWA